MSFVLILSLYLLLFFSFLMLYFFVSYHLIKYSINSKFNRIIFSFFTAGSIFLLVVNLLLFLSVDWRAVSNNLNLL